MTFDHAFDLVLSFCFIFSIISSPIPKAVSSENLGVYYYGNTSAPFEYLKATITIPSKPLPALDEQFVYYYFGLSKKQLSATGIVVFCGTKGGCWGNINGNNGIDPGYSFYAELSQPQ